MSQRKLTSYFEQSSARKKSRLETKPGATSCAHLKSSSALHVTAISFSSLPPPVPSDSISLLSSVPSDSISQPPPVPSDSFSLPPPIPSDSISLLSSVPSDFISQPPLIPSDSISLLSSVPSDSNSQPPPVPSDSISLLSVVPSDLTSLPPPVSSDSISLVSSCPSDSTSVHSPVHSDSTSLKSQILVQSDTTFHSLPCAKSPAPSATFNPASKTSDPIQCSSSSSGCESFSTKNRFDNCNDIGLLLKSMPQSAIRMLSTQDKYSLMVNHFRPLSNFNFPSRLLDGCQRSCQYSYLQKNPWFVYSRSEDGLFCLPCALFANKDNLGQFVSYKFNHWTKKTSKFNSHNDTKFHQLAVTQAEALKSVQMNPSSSIVCQLNSMKAEEIAKNRFIIKQIISAIHLCGKQGIALRGHRDDSTADLLSNRGTLLALLDYSVNSGNSALGSHLESAARNATYTSKTIQNELIGIMGDFIRNKFIKEIKLAKFYSVLCDDVSDVANKEQLSIVLRYLDSSDTIREEFMDFVGTDRITGEALALKIKESLVKYGLDLQNCRGQGYDGATNMSAARGVQGILLAENRKALYVHCKSHILNLCIVAACSLPAIRNMNGTVTESAYFFNNSPKRQMFLELVVNKQTKIGKVKDLCRTRWIYRHEAYECFFELFKYLFVVMVAITEHDETYGIMNWDPKTVVAANGLLKMYSTFGFIYSFVVTMNCMSIIKPISIKLQYKTNDIVYAYSKVKGVIKELQDIRGNDSLLHKWYAQAEALANDIDVQVVVPRTVCRQKGRENVAYNTAEEYYRRSTALPLLDHLIQQMEERFGNDQIAISKILALVPSYMCNESSLSCSLDETIQFYWDDLPNPDVISTELERWKLKWMKCSADNCPSDLQSTLRSCNKDFFPNVHTLLQIACTIPVTTCENERANSTLKNIKTSLRSTMGEERLSALTLMQIHRDIHIDYDDVIDTFKLIDNRRIAL